MSKNIWFYNYFESQPTENIIEIALSNIYCWLTSLSNIETARSNCAFCIDA